MRGRDLVVGTAGHIDHGKTALVRTLTGVDTDRLPAEKERGITIDLGFAELMLAEDRLGLIDVPGHERFIRNMLAGATGLDLALLVVAADDSVMPQTREHLEILGLLGLSSGVIVLTKCDLADDRWLTLVEEDVRGLISGTFLEGGPIVRTSAATGAGIEDLRRELKTVAAAVPSRDDSGLFRLAIDRSFTVPGHGTVVTGTVASGRVAIGDDLELWPVGRPVRVRGLQRHDTPVEEIGRGARTAINLVGIHHTEIERGHELAAIGYLEPSRVLAVELRVSADAPRSIRHRSRYRLHLGTAEVAATLALLDSRELGPGSSGLGQLFLSTPRATVHGQPFVIRSESPAATLGGGRVLQPSGGRIRRHNLGAMERLRLLGSTDPLDRAAAALGGLGLGSWTDRSLCRMAGLRIDDLPPTLERLAQAGRLVELPVGPRRSVRLVSTCVDELEDRLLRALARLHATRPRQSAIPRLHLASELPDLAGETLISGLVERLKVQGKIHAEPRTVALADFEPRLSQAERRLKEQLAASIRAGGFTPPASDDLVALGASRGAVVPELLSLLRDEGRIVAIAPGFDLDADLEAELRRRVQERLEPAATITMAGIRDLLGTSRKFAVPIGEYLDRIGLTVRDGDVRRLGATPGGRGLVGLDSRRARRMLTSTPVRRAHRSPWFRGRHR